MGVHYRSLFPTLTDESHKVGIGDSDLPAEPVHLQIPFLDPASHRPGTDLQKLGGLGHGVERGSGEVAGVVAVTGSDPLLAWLRTQWLPGGRGDGQAL